jgi:hypothetical protein
MLIPIERGRNRHTPQPKKGDLLGEVALSPTPIKFPDPTGDPWPAHCRAFTKPFNKAYCRLVREAGLCQLEMFKSLEQLSKDLWKDPVWTGWEEFLDNNPDANQHYVEFATHFKNLVELFNFDIPAGKAGFEFPLKGKFTFQAKKHHKLPDMWGEVEFTPDATTGAPIKFKVRATNYDPGKPHKHDDSSSSSVYAARSSSSIPGMFIVTPRGKVIPIGPPDDLPPRGGR